MNKGRALSNVLESNTGTNTQRFVLQCYAYSSFYLILVIQSAFLTFRELGMVFRPKWLLELAEDQDQQ